MYIKGHVEMVNTKDQSNAIVNCICYVVCRQCRHIQRKLLKHLGVPPYLIACSMQHVFRVSTYPGSCKVAFLTSFWWEGFLNISNHLPDSGPEAHLQNWPI